MVVPNINFFNRRFHFTSFKNAKTRCDSYTLQYLRTFGVAIAPISTVVSVGKKEDEAVMVSGKTLTTPIVPL